MTVDRYHCRSPGLRTSAIRVGNWAGFPQQARFAGTQQKSTGQSTYPPQRSMLCSGEGPAAMMGNAARPYRRLLLLLSEDWPAGPRIARPHYRRMAADRSALPSLIQVMAARRLPPPWSVGELASLLRRDGQRSLSQNLLTSPLCGST
jgi:hypothetical protein